jgi:hypothetical protein
MVHERPHVLGVLYANGMSAAVSADTVVVLCVMCT